MRLRYGRCVSTVVVVASLGCSLNRSSLQTSSGTTDTELPTTASESAASGMDTPGVDRVENAESSTRDPSQDAANASQGAGTVATAGTPSPEAALPELQEQAGESGDDLTGDGTGSDDGTDPTDPTATPMTPECAVDSLGEICGQPTAGLYGMRVDMDVWWQGAFGTNFTGMINPGRGSLRLFLLGKLEPRCGSEQEPAPVTEPGSALPATLGLTLCGIELPATTSEMTCNEHQLSFPPTTWDPSAMPRSETTASVYHTTETSTIALTPGAGLAGLHLFQPLGPWPPAQQASGYGDSLACPEGTGLDCFADDDQDRSPGLTATFDNSYARGSSAETCSLLRGQPYRLSGPMLATDFASLTSNFATNWADEVHLGVRFAIAGGGVIDSACVPTPVPAPGAALQMRIAGCTRVDEQPCTPEQAAFLDSAYPAFLALQPDEVPQWQDAAGTYPRWTTSALQPSTGSRSAMVRLADIDSEVSCESVRTADYAL